MCSQDWEFSNSVTWTVGNLQPQIGVGALGNSGFNLGGICIYGPIETIRIGGEELWIDNVCFGSFKQACGASAMASMASNNDCETFVTLTNLHSWRNGRSLLARPRAT